MGKMGVFAHTQRKLLIDGEEGLLSEIWRIMKAL